MGTVIEIASYPKCGNTWVRYLLSNIFNIGAQLDIPDIHQQNEKTKNLMKTVILSDEYRFYKSHHLDNSRINPDKILLIYRHPLDVFMSSLNYMFITKRYDFYDDEQLKNVDQLKEDSELEIYFRRFLENLGEDFFKSLLGKNSNYETYLEVALNNEKVVSIKYEDLIEKKLTALKNVLKKLMPNETVCLPENLFATVDDRTKFSGDAFYWKAKSGVHKEYLTNSQIDRFNEKHKDFLAKIGY